VAAMMTFTKRDTLNVSKAAFRSYGEGGEGDEHCEIELHFDRIWYCSAEREIEAYFQ